MPKRKRETEKTGAHLTQEPSPPLRKSARLLEREPHQVLPVQKGKEQRRENEQYRTLPYPSSIGSIREEHCPTIIKGPENSAKEFGAQVSSSRACPTAQRRPWGPP
ncbi:hypothetical protein GJ744_010038 [Endocarpon pusillum]|uniref:Uncharacterized protein n=1 Tax=Endocarpon pusillum TaxID=364733 RepID=A0A8H7AI72_9EURO|nr:hypothetical protein GJ744_010038 [Endocarpon pusillum]